MHMRAQSIGNFYKRIYRRRFFSALNPADENSRKVGLLRQFFLTETGLFASGTNRLAQETTVLLAGVHNQLKKQGPNDVTMSLTTNFSLAQNYRI